MTSQSATPEDRNAPTETEEWILRCAQSGTLKRYENGSWSGDSQWMDSSEEVTAEALLTEGRIAFAGEAIEGWLYRWVRPAIPGASGTPMDDERVADHLDHPVDGCSRPCCRITFTDHLGAVKVWSWMRSQWEAEQDPERE